MADATGTVTGALTGQLGFIKGIVDVLPWVLLIIALFFMTYFISNSLAYNKTVLVWRVASGRKKFISGVKARLIVDKNNVSYWRLNKIKPKILVSPPPNELVDMDTKGRDVVKCYITNNNDLVWINDVSDLDKAIIQSIDIQKKIQDGTKKLSELTVEERNNMSLIANFKPITSNQRASYIYQQEQNKKFAKLNLAVLAPVIASGAILVLALIIFMLFAGKVIDPINEAAQTVNAGKQIDLETVKVLASIQSDIQLIKENQGLPLPEPSGE